MNKQLKSLKTEVFEAMGAISMCWDPIPSGVFESTQAEQIGNELMAKIENDIPNAIKVLSNVMIDKSEGSYYHSWQANIAMTFKDEWSRKAEERNYIDLGKLDIHQIANDAAKNFLNLFLSLPFNDNDVIAVTDKLYNEANPDGNRDVPSFAYEQVERANKRRFEAKSELNLYDWCKLEQENNK